MRLHPSFADAVYEHCIQSVWWAKDDKVPKSEAQHSAALITVFFVQVVTLSIGGEGCVTRHELAAGW